MIEHVRGGVVKLEAGELPTGSSVGTGVIFELIPNRPAAFVLTNYHVIEVAPDNIRATVKGTRIPVVKLLGVDITRDLALLRICCGKFTELPFGDAENLQPGTRIITMGYALDIEGPATTTSGIVSGIRHETDLDRWVIQIDAPINPGNSGGPMLSTSGEILGINTYKFGGLFVEGVGFAVSEETLQEQLPRLMDGGDALDAINVVAEWIYGPEASDERGDVRFNKIPWVLQWTLEGEGSRLEISAREVFQSDSTILVDTKEPGAGKVVVYSHGRFLFSLKGAGKYTVVVKER